MDAIDRRILDLLQRDGKIKIKEIAAALNMSNTPIFERIKRLEKDGVISGYKAVVDRNKLGFHLTAFCAVSLESHHVEYIEQFVDDVRGLSEVAECYHIAGSFDYLLKLYMKDMEDYQIFVSKKLASLANIGKVQSSFVMTEIKNEKVLPTEPFI